MPGQRLSERDRRQIAAGLAQGHTYAAIARRLGRPTSTVTREVMRNGGPNDYHAGRAQRASTQPNRRRGSAGRAGTARPDSGGRDPRLVQRVADQLIEHMVRSGVPRLMARVLAALYTTDSGGLTSAELVRRLKLSPASISKAVGFLEGQELIERQRDPHRRADRYVINGEVWHRAALASARTNLELAGEALRSAELLGAKTPAGLRMGRFANYLRSISEDQLHSAEHWHGVYFADGDD